MLINYIPNFKYTGIKYSAIYIILFILLLVVSFSYFIINFVKDIINHFLKNMIFMLLPIIKPQKARIFNLTIRGYIINIYLINLLLKYTSTNLYVSHTESICVLSYEWLDSIPAPNSACFTSAPARIAAEASLP